jgi:hypothetical protein
MHHHRAVLSVDQLVINPYCHPSDVVVVILIAVILDIIIIIIHHFSSMLNFPYILTKRGSNAPNYCCIPMSFSWDMVDVLQEQHILFVV